MDASQRTFGELYDDLTLRLHHLEIGMDMLDDLIGEAEHSMNGIIPIEDRDSIRRLYFVKAHMAAELDAAQAATRRLWEIRHQGQTLQAVKS